MCNDCSNTTNCLEQNCGCAFEVDAGCIRYTGDDLSCLDVSKGSLLSDVLKNINSKYCDLSSGNYFTLAAEVAGPNCEDGGVKINLVDGDTNTIITTEYLCNGALGPVGPAGLNGEDGLNGIDGTNGVDGNPGGFSSLWKFSNLTSTTEPPIYYLKFDSATPASINTMRISKTNGLNVDMTNFLETFKNPYGSVNQYGLIKIYKKNDSSVFWIGEITNVATLGSGSYSISLSFIQSNGTFTLDDDIVVDYTPFGKGVVYKTKVINFVWDMNASTSININHGLNPYQIVSVTGVVKNDIVFPVPPAEIYPIPYINNTGVTQLWIDVVSDTYLTLSTKTSGYFQSSLIFSSPTEPRGSITILYV